MVPILSVISAYSIHFNIIKNGPNQEYDFLYIILTYLAQNGSELCFKLRLLLIFQIHYAKINPFQIFTA
jgi:hypothetical protein